MKRSEVYSALEAWLLKHGFDTGYTVQVRFWTELDAPKRDRYLVIQQNNGGTTEEAVTRDYFRFVLISARNDRGVSEVEDNADAIRQAMIDEYKTECIVSMKPIGGIPSNKTKEGRYLFEINFQTIISR
jgi:hypothetical protein